MPGDRRKIKLDSEGIALHGELFAPPTGDTLVVLVHGIPLSRPDPSDGGYLELAGALADSGRAALYFNMRGTGDSGGNFHIGGWYTDLCAMMGYVRRELAGGFRSVVLAGFSAGGVLAIRYVAEHHGVDGIAAFATPARLTTLFTEDYLFAFLELARDVGIIRQFDFPPDPQAFYRELEENQAIDYVARVSPVPLLLVHGEADEMVSADDAGELSAAAGDPKTLVLLPGAEHRLRRDPRTLSTLLEWLDNLA